MEYRLHRPAPPLDRYIHALWFWAGHQPAHQFERLMPDGSVELVFNLAEDRFLNLDPGDPTRFSTTPGAVVAGVHSRYLVVGSRHESLLGVHFYPGGAWPFLRVPLDQTHNRELALEDLWGPRARQVRQRLLDAPTTDRRFQVLELELLRIAAGRLEGHPAVRYAVDCIQRRPAASSIEDVVERTGLSASRFIRLFRREVGLTPKTFCRIRRFQQAIHSIVLGRDIDWTALALDCGYYDQPHFIHDFRAFSGLTPTEYTTRRAHHPNHVAQH